MSTLANSGSYCRVCAHPIPTGQLPRQHLETPWHKSNVLARLHKQKPLSLAEFNQEREKKMQAQKQAENVTAFSGECLACKRTFASEATFKTHVESKRHKERLAAYESRKEKLSSGKSDVNEEEGISLTEVDCLFCLHRSKEMEDNLNHMAKQHNFFIPDVEYVSNVGKMLVFLGERLSEEHSCFSCKQPFSTLEAVRSHMIHARHAYILEDEEDYDEFYDYMLDAEEDLVMVEGENDEEEEAWEDVEEDEEGDEEQENLLRLSDDGTQLILPNGTVVGHRAFRIYWNQNLSSPLISNRNRDMTKRISSMYTSLGQVMIPPSTGSQVSKAVALKTQIQQIKAVEKKMIRKQKYFQERMGAKGNMQKHFRNQLGFST